MLALSADAAHCADVTDDYLRPASDGGRVDATHAAELPRYRATVAAARLDATGRLCQARTLGGHVLERAGLGADDVSRVLRRAADDHGAVPWWALVE